MTGADRSRPIFTLGDQATESFRPGLNIVPTDLAGHRAAPAEGIYGVVLTAPPHADDGFLRRWRHAYAHYYRLEGASEATEPVTNFDLHQLFAYAAEHETDIGLFYLADHSHLHAEALCFLHRRDVPGLRRSGLPGDIIRRVLANFGNLANRLVLGQPAFLERQLPDQRTLAGWRNMRLGQTGSIINPGRMLDVCFYAPANDRPEAVNEDEQPPAVPAEPGPLRQLGGTLANGMRLPFAMLKRGVGK